MGFRTCTNPRQRYPDFEVILTRNLGVNIRAVIKAALFIGLSTPVSAPLYNIESSFYHVFSHLPSCGRLQFQDTNTASPASSRTLTDAQFTELKIEVIESLNKPHAET